MSDLRATTVEAPDKPSIQDMKAGSMKELVSQRFLFEAQEGQGVGDRQKVSDKNASKDTHDLAIDHQQTNPDGTVVKFDSEGRAQALIGKDGKPIHEFHYKDKAAREPDSIKLSDGTVLSKTQTLVKDGDKYVLDKQLSWMMEPAGGKGGSVFNDSTVRVNADGSFAISYKGVLDPATHKHDVMKEISFQATGKQAPEIAKQAVMRDGTEQSIDKEGVIHQKNGDKEKLIFPNSSMVKMENGRIVQAIPPGDHNRVNFSYDGQGAPTKIADQQDNSWTRKGTPDKDGFAEWQSSDGTRITAKPEIGKKGDVRFVGKDGKAEVFYENSDK